MKILNCPLNGPRNISEFLCLGEIKQSPATGADAAEWADHVFMENNPAGKVREWWCHIPTNYVFIVERDTRTEAILDTYPAPRPDLDAGSAADPGARSAP